MRAKIKILEEAFGGLPVGGFDDHHRFLLGRMLGRVDAIEADIAVLGRVPRMCVCGPGRSEGCIPVMT
jgi:hypothetical protein